METNFLCPRCKGYLNAGGNVVFATKNNKGKCGVILLHEQLGNYTVLRNSNYEYVEGEQLEFHCPMCHTKLRSKMHSNLAMVVMQSKTEEEYKVFFSEVAGEKSTYVLVGDNMDIHGKDANQYINFFNLSQTL